MAETTKTYPQYPRSSFPEQVDNFAMMQDPTAYQMTIVKQYETLVTNGDIDGAAALILQYPELEKSLFNAKKFNHLSDGLKATQQFFKEDVETYVADLFQHTVGIDDKAEGDAKGTNAYSGKKVDQLFDLHNQLVTIDVTAGGWVLDSDLYIQTVYTEKISEDMNPLLVSMISLYLDDATPKTKKYYNKAFGIISSGTMTTHNGYVVFKAAKKPEHSVTVGLKGV